MAGTAGANHAAHQRPPDGAVPTHPGNSQLEIGGIWGVDPLLRAAGVRRSPQEPREDTHGRHEVPRDSSHFLSAGRVLQTQVASFRWSNLWIVPVQEPAPERSPSAVRSAFVPPAMAGQPGSTADMPQLPGATVTDLQYNLAHTYVGVLSVLFTLSTLIVILRIVSRWKTNKRLDADDYLIVGAGVSVTRPSRGSGPAANKAAAVLRPG